MKDNSTKSTSLECSKKDFQSFSGKPRLKNPVRDQVEFSNICLDDCLPEDHKVRLVWEFVCQIDLSEVLGEIKSVVSHPGAPAISPKILFALWLYAFIEGINSAHVISRYCEEHIAFKWICGGVKVNSHTISDFRSKNVTLFNNALTQSIGILSYDGIVDLERVAQDGIKVKACAGSSSFRRTQSLEKHLKQAEEYIKQLDKELKENPNKYSLKQTVAKKRGAEERAFRIKQAIEELKQHTEKREKSLKKQRKKLSEEDRKNIRSSTTDPEARIMKMPGSGFAPAYNVQFSTDSKLKAILGVQVVNACNDYGQLAPMQEQLKERYGQYPKEILADEGFLDYSDVEKVTRNSIPYIPADKIKEDQSQVLLKLLKKRMETEEAKEIYKDRAATAEFVNARVRTRGFTQLLVRGLEKAASVAVLFALGQNMLIWISLQN